MQSAITNKNNVQTLETASYRQYGHGIYSNRKCYRWYMRRTDNRNRENMSMHKVEKPIGNTRRINYYFQKTRLSCAKKQIKQLNSTAGAKTQNESADKQCQYEEIHCYLPF